MNTHRHTWLIISKLYLWCSDVCVQYSHKGKTSVSRKFCFVWLLILYRRYLNASNWSTRLLWDVWTSDTQKGDPYIILFGGEGTDAHSSGIGFHNAINVSHILRWHAQACTHATYCTVGGGYEWIRSWNDRIMSGLGVCWAEEVKRPHSVITPINALQCLFLMYTLHYFTSTSIIHIST